MSRAAGKLRLGPLPRTDTVKLTVSLSAELKQSLDDYAAAHSQVNGETVDAATLIPHMLQAFIARDRGFKAMTSKRTASSAPAPAP
jgi:hypothetical protein